MSKKPRKTPSKQPVKKPLFDKRLLIGAVVFGTLVVLLSYCVKEEPPPVPVARSAPQVVAPASSLDTAATDTSVPATDPWVSLAEESAPLPVGSMSVRFKTPIVRGGPGVEVVAEGIGSNGSPLTFDYEWRVNREPVPDLSGPILPWDKVKRGDRISLQVTSIDGETRGKPVVTEEIVLPNSPPQFVTTPILNFRADEYVYEAKAEDADRDSLTFALETGPAGMSVDAATGRLTWRIVRDQAGEHVVKLVVSDPEGGRAVQEYSLSVTIP